MKGHARVLVLRTFLFTLIVGTVAGAAPSVEKPAEPSGRLVLEDAMRPGIKVDVAAYRGKPVVIRGISPECPNWGRVTSGCLVEYGRLQREYADRVQFLPVRPDFGHGQNKDYAQRYEEAQEWARRVKLQGPLLVDDEQSAFMYFGKGAIPSWAAAQADKPGDKPKSWGIMYILNQDGKIVFQTGHVSGFYYYTSRLVLDRLLDAEFDEAFRRGFPDKPRALPVKEKSGGATTYRDDFESYKDSYDFVLQPRWGFKTSDNVEQRGRLKSRAGRGESTAADLRVSSPRHNLEHIFPRPLADGSLRFYVRRGVPYWDKREPATILEASFYGRTDKKTGVPEKAGALKVAGEWGKELFSLADRAGQIKLSKDGWHEIRVEVKPQAPSRVTVDGKLLGELSPGPLTGIGLNCGLHGFFLDDVEIVYRPTAGEN
ncbi:MAG: hypothetical protein J7M08_03840 [Planctomycetes bacterium]|nr:hypothetical protein [Planctomycetota bacterium]